MFTIYGGWGCIRRALLNRGWIEKLHPGQLQQLQALSQHSLLAKSANGNDYEVAALSKLLNASAVHFVWQPKKMKFRQFENVKPFKNRLLRNRWNDFTIKEGLCQCAKEQHWCHLAGQSELNCPRSYRLFLTDEVAEFMDDYRFTGCTSLVAFMAAKFKESNGGDMKELFDVDGTVRTCCIEFAVKRIAIAINRKDHLDIDDNYSEESLDTLHWQEFFKDYHALIRLGEKFKAIPAGERNKLCNFCVAALADARLHWPNIDFDGYSNIWIMKPSGKNRGIGVMLMKDNLQVVDYAFRNKRQRYIVQKYLGKFDGIIIIITGWHFYKYYIVHPSLFHNKIRSSSVDC